MNPASVHNYTDDSGNPVGDVDFFDDAASINVLSKLWAQVIPSANIYAFAEIGLSAGFGIIIDSSTNGYGPIEESGKPSYSGLEEEDVLEFLLWQSSSSNDVFSFNVTAVEGPIPGLETEHLDTHNRSMPAIGIRCTASSVTGNAKINGLAGTFSGFSRFDPDRSPVFGVSRFGIGMPVMLLQGNMSEVSMSDNFIDIYAGDFTYSWGDSFTVDYTLISTNINWIQPLFTAASMQSKPLAGGFVNWGLGTCGARGV
jgi:hypothetical protein